MLLWASMTLIGLASFIIAFTVFQGEEDYKATEKLDEEESKKQTRKQNSLLKSARPLYMRYFLPLVVSMKNRKKYKEMYKRQIATAGLTDQISSEEFFAFKLSLIFAFPALFVGFKLLGDMDGLEYSWIPAIGLFGYFYPNIWLSGLMEERQKNMLLAMPFIVDLLALSVEAGLDFVAAMSRVIEKAPSTPLSEEFEIMMKEIKIGQPRAEALRNMSWRANLTQITSFSATLIAADSVGASIAPILKSLAQEMRQARSAKAEQEGAKAATKIMFPMFMFILPAIFITIAVPMFMDFIAK